MKNHNITELFTSNSLKDKRCFLLGGGLSLIGFDYSLLDGEFTIGVNKTFTVFNPTINYSMDLKLYNYLIQPTKKHERRSIQESLIDFTGHKVFLCPKKNQIPIFAEGWFVISRLLEESLSLDIEKGIFPGTNSGFGALMLDISMGCKEIYLLGYDLKVLDNKTHWHKGYLNKDAHLYEKTLFPRYRQEFEEFSDTIEDEGVKVVNFSNTSTIKCFPKDVIGNVLKQSKAHV